MLIDRGKVVMVVLLPAITNQRCAAVAGQGDIFPKRKKALLFSCISRNMASQPYGGIPSKGQRQFGGKAPKLNVSIEALSLLSARLIFLEDQRYVR